MSAGELNLNTFTETLASKSPTPGGGGAAALAGAIGIALASMVGNLTIGKSKYTDVEEDVIAILDEAEALRSNLLRLIDRDAEVFAPVAKAYSLPKGEERDQVMEPLLREASSVPLEIMTAACRAIDLHERLGGMTNAAISDIGVGVACCRAALLGASLNVLINTKSMTDRNYADSIDKEAQNMLEHYTAVADKVFRDIEYRLR